MKKQYFYLGLVLMGLAGCVEVKDSKDDSTKSLDRPTEGVQMMVEPQKSEQLIVDQPLYIYGNRIVTEQELKDILKSGKSESDNQRDLEFSFDEVHFSQGGVLYTMGVNFRIHTKSLYSDGGRISTYPEKKKAKRGAEGRPGGHIFIDAQTAVGTLKIEMRGEQGGDGELAKAPDTRLKGPMGSRGQNGLCYAFSSAKPTPATNGEIGGIGLKGYPGNNGKRGGDSGTLELLIEDGKDFTYSVQKFPGLGGAGSPGGAGGEGGEGGAPGEYPNKRAQGFCETPQSGEKGPRGPSGDDGARGPEGVNQTSCVTKSKAMSCYI